MVLAFKTMVRFIAKASSRLVHLQHGLNKFWHAYCRGTREVKTYVKESWTQNGYLLTPKIPKNQNLVFELLIN
jgi:hypothetical protein